MLSKRARLIVLIVCGVTIGLLGLRILMRLTRPSDGLLIDDYPQTADQIGVRFYIGQGSSTPTGMRTGDVIVSVDDRSVGNWLQILFEPGRWTLTGLDPYLTKCCTIMCYAL